MCVSRPRTLGGRREGERERVIACSGRSSCEENATQRGQVAVYTERRDEPAIVVPNVREKNVFKRFLFLFIFPIFGTFDFCNQ